MTMTSGKEKFRHWHIVGGCVRGASHIRSDMPCQDALRIDADRDYCIVSISDGHGSTKCPYSDEGAKAAVDTACAVFRSILDSKGDPFHTISSNKDIWLPKQIEQHWKNAVQEIHKKQAREDMFSYELYGATLLTLIATGDFVFALQVGDGDILSIEAAEEGSDETLRVDWVIPADGQLGPETNSLCQDDCWQYMKTRLIPLAPEATAPMFFMSTDGYANSFSNDQGFKQAGADFYRLWHDEGPAYIEDNLDGWLMESSAQGSGDDIAAALLIS